jgi:uncharacterized protein (TIGR02996 family)
VARFERDGQFVEVWVERRDERADRGYVWPELRSRSGRVGAPEAPEVVTLERRFEWSARGDYRQFQSARLREGWRRVRDPDREPAFDEPIEPALDAALRANPSDAAAALVYADWLQHRGHPRGELIAIQHERIERPDDLALAAAEQHVLETHADVLWAHARAPDAHKNEGGVEVTWERGFIRRARILGFHDDGASEDLLWELLRHPSARFLRELELGCHHAGDQNNELMSDLLVRAGPTPPLRSLVLADFDDSEIDNIDISRAPLGDLTGLGERYPELESVTLKGTGDVVLGDLRLPRARRFALRTSTLERTTLAAIVRAPWPALEELELWFGDPLRGYGADCELADVEPLFQCALPKLRTLSLRNAMFSDEIVPAILAWPGAAQLERLDFALGTLSDAGADALIAGRAALRALAHVGVFECALSTAGLQRLRAAFPDVDDRAITPAHAWREPRQKPARYVSVSE